MSSHSDSGIKQLLKTPLIYHCVQLIFGLKKVWKTLAYEFICPSKDMKILDIGSGTSGILEFLHGFDVEYHGYDLNEEYIHSSKRKWAGQGRYYFHATPVNELKVENTGNCDVVLAINLLHHLDDAEADRVLEVAFAALKDSGKFITCDPCIFAKMNLIETFMVKHDRGRNIRTAEQYTSLAKKCFTRINIHIKSLSNIPQRGLIMECYK